MDLAIGIAIAMEQQPARRFEKRLHRKRRNADRYFVPAARTDQAFVFQTFEQRKLSRRADHHILRGWIDDRIELGLDWHLAYSTRRPLLLGFTRLGLNLR
jgi:hypothetical protein